VPNFASAGISIFNTAILELTGSKSAPVLEEKTEEEQKTNQALHQWMISSMSMGACNKYNKLSSPKVAVKNKTKGKRVKR
jgi:hypothetical protein